MACLSSSHNLSLIEFQVRYLVFLSNGWLQVVLDGNCSQEYPVNAGVPQGSILGPTLSPLYINDLAMLSVILLSMLMILLSILSVINLICTNTLNWLLNLNMIYETLWSRVRSGLLISMLGNLSWFRLTSLIKMVLLM